MAAEPAAVRDGGTTVEIGILGPMRVCVAGQLVAITAPRCRAVFAALVVAVGRPVPIDQLAATVWDGGPPTSAEVTLRNYVKQVRQRLGPAASRLVTTPAAYRFAADPDELDLLAFLRLRDAAAVACRSGDWARLEDLCEDALRLWRGPPLIDVACAALHSREVPRLERLHTQISEWHAEAGLRLGHGDQLIEALHQLVDRHPLHERFHAQLMIALARSGRRAEALDAYRHAHHILLESLGIEPGAELQAVHRQILRTSSRGAGAARLDAVTDRAAPVLAPRQLPASTLLVGRDRHCARLTAHLAASTNGTAGRVAAIDGMAGVGKTALAVHWARQVASQFPDGQIYLDLRGFDPAGIPVPAQSAQHAVLGSFGIPDDRIPVDADARTALYRSVLADRRVLIVLDNASDAQHVRPLLPGGTGCFALVTSRSALSGLVAGQAACRLHLDLLEAGDARLLLAARLGEQVDEDPAAVAELVEQCARLPLALTLAAARAAARPDLPLTALTAELRDAGRRVDALDVGDRATALGTVFSWSYHRLTETTAMMFRMLGLNPCPDLTVPAAASLAATPLNEAASALAELSQAHLVTETERGRFWVHDLLRAYAAQQAQRHDDQDARRAATGRILDHYLYSVHAAALLIDPDRQSPPLEPRSAAVVVERPDNVAVAMRWLDAERQALLTAVDAAARDGYHEHASRLSWELAPYFDRRGHWHDYITTQRTAHSAATEHNDAGGQARASRHLGRARFAFGDYRAAADHLLSALRIYERLGVLPAQAGVHTDVARVYQKYDHTAALRHARQAYDLYSSIGYQPGQATALGTIGLTLALSGDAHGSRTYCARALWLQYKLGNRYGLAHAWQGLGYACHQLRRFPGAEACYRRAIGLFVEFEDRYNEAATLSRLGDTAEASGDMAGARSAWHQALAIFADLQHPDAAAVGAKLAG